MRRQVPAPSRVTWDLRQLPLPPSIQDPASNVDSAQRQISPLLPDCVPEQGEKKTILLGNHARYVGESTNGQATGKGVIQYANGDQYEGEVREGYAHGYGVATSAVSGLCFRGRFEAGRQADGVQSFEDGYTFEGRYKGNAAHGPGTLFDSSGFILRASFVDGQPHGLGHAHYRSGESFMGEFRYGRMASGPGIVRYADGRVALRLMHGDATTLEVIAQNANGVFMQELLAQEQAIEQEAWLTLCEVRHRMQRLAKRADTISFKAPQWSLLSWVPNESEIVALSHILTSVGNSTGTTHKAMRDLLRCVLHLRGPARPYATSGEVEGKTCYTPAVAYANMQAFVTDTVLPHFGTSNIVLGGATAGQQALSVPYRLDGERGFALRFGQAVDDVARALSAAYAKDTAHNDAALSRSRAVLCSILDGTLRFDAKLSRMHHTLEALQLKDAPGAPSVSSLSMVSGGPCLPPVVVAVQERGCSYRRARTQFSALSAPNAFRARARSASLGSRPSGEAIGRLSPMIEVSDGSSPSNAN